MPIPLKQQFYGKYAEYEAFVRFNSGGGQIDAADARRQRVGIIPKFEVKTELPEAWQRDEPARIGRWLPLSGFSYSCSLGVSPSSGSAKISGIYVNEDFLSRVNLENIEFMLVQNGQTVVQFKQMRLIDAKVSPSTAKTGSDKVWDLVFEDKRWVLQHGGVFGYFNILIGILDGKYQFDIYSLKDGETPWSYKLLFEWIFRHAFEIPAPGKKTGYGEFTFNVDAQLGDRLSEFPLNKKWEGKKPADVLAEILSEINCTLSIKPDGTFVISPLTGHFNPPDAEDLSANSSTGIKYHPIPEAVFLVGASVRDQIKIRPNIEKFQKALEKYVNVEPSLAKELSGASESSSGPAAPTSFTVSTTLNVDPGTPIIEGEELSIEDMGLEPICPDITGRIRNFYELLDTWGVSLEDASLPYQTAQESALRNVLAPGVDIPIGGFEPTDEEAEEALGPGADQETIDSWKRQEKQARAEQVEADQQFEASRPERLYPEELEFLDKNPDFDALTSKVNIAKQYFFKLFRLPPFVMVEYLWEGELSTIHERLMPEAPQGKTPVPREFILPCVEYIDEDFLDSLEKKEELERQKRKAQSGSKKSTGGKSQKGKGQVRGTDQPPEVFGKARKARQRFRIWGYHFCRQVAGTMEFVFVNIKEQELKCANADLERGIFLLQEAPYMTGSYEGFSEDCPFVRWACPVGIEFTYERKDPRLGPLNYFIHEMRKPGIVKGTPASRKKNEEVYEFSRINEFIEFRKDGREVNREELAAVSDKYAEQIWIKAVGEHDAQYKAEFTAPADAYPLGPVQVVTWQTNPFVTTFEVNSDFSRFRRTSLRERLKKELEAAGLWKEGHRSWMDYQESNDRRGGWVQAWTDRFQDNERRIVQNLPHFGAFVMYDPREMEDVIATSATLKDATTHIHSKWWIGPLLCREPIGHQVTYNAQWVPLYGHFWWAQNGEDRCPYNHTHRMGGFYYPYVYVPPEAFLPPPVVKNPIPGFEVRMPQVVYIANEPGGVSDAKAKGQKFPDEEAVPAPLQKRERLSGNFRTVPRGEDGKTLKAGLLVEYCIEPVLLGGDSSAVFYVDWELIKDGESYKAPTRAGSGYYVLPLAQGIAGYGKRIHLLCEFGPVDTIDDYDEVYCDFMRAYGFDQDLFRDDVYVTSLKFVYGYDLSTPQVATIAPI